MNVVSFAGGLLLGFFLGLSMMCLCMIAKTSDLNENCVKMNEQGELSE